MITAALLCLVTHVHDGDRPLWCENGLKVRVAGIQAPDFENAEPCRRSRAAYVCSNVQAKRSRAIIAPGAARDAHLSVGRQVLRPRRRTLHAAGWAQPVVRRHCGRGCDAVG
jgi:hypothetical protein